MSLNNNKKYKNMEKLRTVRLYGKLGTKYGREHKLYVSSTNEAIRALSVQIPGFMEELRDSDKNGIAYAVFNGRKNIEESDLKKPGGDEDIRIAPIVHGSKRSGLFQTILGAVLIATAFVMPATAGFTVLGYGANATAFAMGASMLLGGVAQLLSPQPVSNIDYSDGRNNTSFSGPINNTVAGVPVPIAIGRVIVGSSVISGGVVAEDVSV